MDEWLGTGKVDKGGNIGCILCFCVFVLVIFNEILF